MVDDETSIGRIAVAFLHSAGFEAAFEADPESALAAERERPFDAVLCDVFIRDTYGPDLVARIRELHPGMPVLYMSGDSHHALERGGEILDERTGFLAKPFTADVLAERLDGLLERKGASR